MLCARMFRLEPLSQVQQKGKWLVCWCSFRLADQHQPDILNSLDEFEIGETKAMRFDQSGPFGFEGIG